MTAFQNYILLTILFLSMINLSKALAEMSSDDNNENLAEQRREYDFNKLRRFLLTSNSEQRNARREQQDFFKRELIREYLQAITDDDTERFQEIKKRLCASFDEFYATQAACLG